MQRLGRHALVIGGSMGGLLAARALADFYDQVTVVERDRLTPEVAARKGVPQGRHAHGLLAKGREILEELFPGFTQELVARGALTGDLAAQSRWYLGGGYLRRRRSGLIGVAVSRPLLETHVRQRLLALPNVHLMDGAAAEGLLTSDDRSRVTGVRLARRDGAEGAGEETVEADLVVDAAGRGSRTPAWLEAIGYPRPDEDEVVVDVGYTSRWYRRGPDQPNSDRVIVISGNGTQLRGAVLMAQDGERWLLSLGGYLGDHAPTDEEGFLAFVRSLPRPDIYDIVKNAEPLGEPVYYRYRASRRLRYERLNRFPAGLLTFGDAISSFNPLYGQGMTAACMEALALRDCLADGTNGLAVRFFRKAAEIVDVPWDIAVGGALVFPGIDGKPTARVRFVNWYVDKLQVAARRDGMLAVTFHQVTNLTMPPAQLLHPRIALRVLAGNIGPSRRSRPGRGVRLPVGAH
ncbi:MAG: monooxygenase [Dehalococcoidia bacterium]